MDKLEVHEQHTATGTVGRVEGLGSSLPEFEQSQTAGLGSHSLGKDSSGSVCLASLPVGPEAADLRRGVAQTPLSHKT